MREGDSLLPNQSYKTLECVEFRGHGLTPIIGESFNTGRWTVDEHRRFLAALRLYGREWSKIQLAVPSRSTAQIRSHAQKYFSQQAKIRGSDFISTTCDGAVPSWLDDEILQSNVSQEIRKRASFIKIPINKKRKTYEDNIHEIDGAGQTDEDDSDYGEEHMEHVQEALLNLLQQLRSVALGRCGAEGEKSDSDMALMLLNWLASLIYKNKGVIETPMGYMDNLMENGKEKSLGSTMEKPTENLLQNRMGNLIQRSMESANEKSIEAEYISILQTPVHAPFSIRCPRFVTPDGSLIYKE